MYSRTRIASELSSTADYANPLVVSPADVLSSPTAKLVDTVTLSTAAKTIVLDTLFSTITGILIENTSSVAAEIVSATWFALGATASDTVSFTQNAAGDYVDDDSGTSTWTTGTGLRAGSYVRFTMCASATNGSTTAVPNTICWLVQTAAATKITFVAQTTLVASANDALTISFETKNTQPIPAGGSMFIGGNVVPVGALALVSASGTPTVNIYVYGT